MKLLLLNNIIKNIKIFILRIKKNKFVNNRKNVYYRNYINVYNEVMLVNKYKKLGYIFLVLIIVTLSFTVYATVSKDNEKIDKDKRISELEYLESELLDIFNQLNNIETNNYNVSVNNITKQVKNKDENSNNMQEQQTKEKNSNSSSNSENNASTNDSTKQSDSKQQKEFNLKSNAVLTDNQSINWDNIKSQVETLYSSIPTITLDFYQANINQEDILNFNKEFDNLAVAIKQENKENCLALLSKLYDYFSEFSQNIYDEELQKVIIETKSNILKAYSKLDSKNWESLSNDIKQAINVYSKLLTDTNIDQSKQYTISKIYIMINELQNAVQVQDESIFLIKYKNIIEQVNTLT